MLDRMIQPQISGHREINDEEYFDQAEGEIGGYGRPLVSGITTSGEMLTWSAQ